MQKGWSGTALIAGHQSVIRLTEEPYLFVTSGSTVESTTDVVPVGLCWVLDAGPAGVRSFLYML